MNYFYKICILFLLVSSSCFATHIKGGEIRADHISGQTYKISVLLYIDLSSSASDAQTDVSVCMGDQNVITAKRVAILQLPEKGVTVNTFEANYTYPSQGRFQISASINDRNSAINFPKGNESPLFLWTVISTELVNSTPVMPYLTFSAGVKQVFSIDLKPANTDGDSISVRLQKLSKGSPGTCKVRMIDSTYIYPNDVTTTGTFKINQAEKKLTWIAPEQVGSYLYAMVVYEWRDGINISESYREGTIDVSDKPGSTVEIPTYEYAENPGEIITAIPSLDSPEISILVEAYPVPTENFVTVKAYSKKQSVIRLQLIDMQGRVLDEIKSQTPQASIEEQFDLRKYPKGIYIIRAENDIESVSQKILR